jgi:cysteine synthase A
MAQRLGRVFGLGVGISSGANLLGALEVAVQQGSDSWVVTVFCDDSKKYLSTDLTRTLPVAKGNFCDEIELLSWHRIDAQSPSKELSVIGVGSGGVVNA